MVGTTATTDCRFIFCYLRPYIGTFFSKSSRLRTARVVFKASSTGNWSFMVIIQIFMSGIITNPSIRLQHQVKIYQTRMSIEPSVVAELISTAGSSAFGASSSTLSDD